MFKARRPVAALLLFSLGTMTSACGEDEEEDTPAIGTCDRRSTAYGCIELHDASAIDFDNQREGCAEAGGDWSTETCPSEDLVGCCDYTHGNKFHECFYTGYTGDAESSCTDLVSGVWTPAS